MNYWDSIGRWINTVLVLIVSVLAFDALFRLLNASEDNAIVTIVSAMAVILLVPFQGMFGEQDYILTALIGVLIYALLAGFALAVLRSVQATLARPAPSSDPVHDGVAPYDPALRNGFANHDGHNAGDAGPRPGRAGRTEAAAETRAPSPAAGRQQRVAESADDADPGRRANGRRDRGGRDRSQLVSRRGREAPRPETARADTPRPDNSRADTSSPNSRTEQSTDARSDEPRARRQRGRGRAASRSAQPAPSPGRPVNDSSENDRPSQGRVARRPDNA